jgi:hypothetical protein
VDAASGGDEHEPKTRRLAHVQRPLITVLVSVATAGALGGCWFRASERKAAEEIVLPHISRALHFVADTYPDSGALSKVAAGLASAVDRGTNIKAQLDTIAASDDPYGKALVTATCYGLGRVAKQSRENDGNVIPPSAQEWGSFLTDEVAALLPEQPASAIQSRVTQFNNAAQLQTINPRVAQVYVEQCALRRR